MTLQATAAGKTAPCLRFGLAGTGSWAEEIHLPVLRSHPGVLLTGIWDRTRSRAETLANAAGIQAFDRFEAMLDAVDAVSIAVAPQAQPGLAKLAASRGRLLLLEKPLALTVEDGLSVVSALEKAKLASVVFFTRRFDSRTADNLNAIVNRRSWQTATAQFLSGAMLPGTPYTGSVWRQQLGALWDLGPHALSLLLPALGEVVAVSAANEALEITRLHLTHTGGKTSDLALSVKSGPDRQGESYLFQAGDQAARLNVALDTTLRRAAYGRALDSLIEAQRTGVPHPCNALFGLQVVKILVAAQKSRETGVPVTLDQEAS